MGEPKSFASLSPRLLARKGGAKPAMRRQIQPLNDLDIGLAAEPQDDLGWNDMGEDAPATARTEPVEAVRTQAEIVSLHGASTSQDAEPPQVVARQKALAARIERRPVTTSTFGLRRAAFTLRIDRDRHLQLRLASTVSGRSAQSLLTDALDRMIEEMPEIVTLAENVRKRS
jgi:hypothetical protein